MNLCKNCVYFHEGFVSTTCHHPKNQKGVDPLYGNPIWKYPPIVLRENHTYRVDTCNYAGTWFKAKETK